MTSLILFPLLVALQAATPKPIESLPPMPATLVSAMSHDHQRLALATAHGGIVVLNVASGQVAVLVPDRAETITSLDWKPDGSALAVRRIEGSFEEVAAASGTVLSSAITAAGRGSIEYAAGGRVVLLSVGAAGMEVWPCGGGDRIAQVTTDARRMVTTFAVSPDGSYLALGDALGGVAAWKLHGVERVAKDTAVPRGHDHVGVFSLAFDPSNRMLAIGSGDCSARVWSIGSDDAPRVFSHCDADLFSGNLSIGCAKFSPDGTRLITTSFDFWEARVWDVASGERLGSFDYGGGNPGAMPAWFSSDSKYVTTSLNCVSAFLGDRDRPASFPRGRLSESAREPRYESDGDYAWAVVDHHLVVRKIPDEEPILRVKVRER